MSKSRQGSRAAFGVRRRGLTVRPASLSTHGASERTRRRHHQQGVRRRRPAPELLEDGISSVFIFASSGFRFERPEPHGGWRVSSDPSKCRLDSLKKLQKILLRAFGHLDRPRTVERRECCQQASELLLRQLAPASASSHQIRRAWPPHHRMRLYRPGAQRRSKATYALTRQGRAASRARAAPVVSGAVVEHLGISGGQRHQEGEELVAVGLSPTAATSASAKNAPGSNASSRRVADGLRRPGREALDHRPRHCGCTARPPWVALRSEHVAHLFMARSGERRTAPHAQARRGRQLQRAQAIISSACCQRFVGETNTMKAWPLSRRERPAGLARTLGQHDDQRRWRYRR